MFWKTAGRCYLPRRTWKLKETVSINLPPQEEEEEEASAHEEEDAAAADNVVAAVEAVEDALATRRILTKLATAVARRGTTSGLARRARKAIRPQDE